MTAGFDYVRPASLDEACRLLDRPDAPSAVLAGGTDLLVRIKKGNLRPQTVISLRDLSELCRLSCAPGRGARIGPMVTLDALECSAEILKNLPGLAEAAGQIGSAQVRSRATIGGNLCNARRGADMAPSLLSYGATVTIRRGLRERTIPVEHLFAPSGETLLAREELLSEVQVPEPPERSFGTFLKVSPPGLGPTLASLGLLAVFEPHGTSCRELRLAIGSPGERPVRAGGAEGIAAGRELADALIDEVSLAASAEVPLDSALRASGGGRRAFIQAMTRKALVAARSWAQKGVGA